MVKRKDVEKMRYRPRVLILSCGTGEGHNSAAKAIEANLKEKDVFCEVKDVLSFRSEKAGGRAAGVYNTVIKKAPKLFGAVYTLGRLYDNLRLPSPIYKLNSAYAEKLYAYITVCGFQCIVCTHLFAMEAMTAVRRSFYLTARCYGVLTDYTMHPFIKDSDLDGYFVPNEQTRRQFVRKGFAKEKVFPTGIPVHPKFVCKTSKQEARERLNIPREKKVVAVMTGGAGCGRIVSLCKELASDTDGSHLIFVFTGRNGKLKQKLDGRFAHDRRFRTVAFTPDIGYYLNAADVVISKSGGLSSTEIAVMNVPLVHLKAIPGLETANLKYFSDNGLSFRADNVKAAVAGADRLLSDRALAEEMMEKQRRYIKAGATESLVGKITEEIERAESAYTELAENGQIAVGQYPVFSDEPEAVGAQTV